mmetsp:Transcript_12573/g.37791  ORF Transcript_12573/g.37791 Transcript_12573/m.37791 type:complete len:263 (-) Transcript_12573:1132-1920(-)
MTTLPAPCPTCPRQGECTRGRGASHVGCQRCRRCSRARRAAGPCPWVTGRLSCRPSRTWPPCLSSPACRWTSSRHASKSSSCAPQIPRGRPSWARGPTRHPCRPTAALVWPRTSWATRTTCWMTWRVHRHLPQSGTWRRRSKRWQSSSHALSWRHSCASPMTSPSRTGPTKCSATASLRPTSILRTSGRCTVSPRLRSGPSGRDSSSSSRAARRRGWEVLGHAVRPCVVACVASAQLRTGTAQWTARRAASCQGTCLTSGTS